MKIIALKGAANSGKTYTLNTTYTLLLNAGYMQVPGYFTQPEVYNFLGEKMFGSLDFTDILVQSDKKIGVTTGTKNELAPTLDSFQKAGCSVVICACHDSSDEISTIESYGDTVFIEKTPQSTISLKRINDFTFAKRIVSLA
jgi:hypothetical protein